MDAWAQMAEARRSKLVRNFAFNPVSAACLEGSTEAVEKALSESGNAATDKDEVGWSPIHFASWKDQTTIVDLLLKRGFSPLAETPEGNTPLHLASQNGCEGVVNKLLESLEPERLVECKNKEGNTPVHLACREGQVGVVNELLKCSKQPLPLTNTAGATPLGVALQNRKWETARTVIRASSSNPASTFPDFKTHFPVCSTAKFLEFEPLNVFVTGDTGSGKSTLIKALQMQGWFANLASTVIGVRNVDQHRVGIVPTVTEYERKHRVVFYDFSGHRDYTHEAIFDCFPKPSPQNSMFIITVDMRDSSEIIERKILYWLNFVWQKWVTLPTSQRSIGRPNVLVVGTFADRVGFRVARLNLQIICQNVSESNQAFMARLNWHGNFTLDCRSYSWYLNQLRITIQEQCQQFQPGNTTDTRPECYILATLLETEFADKRAIRFMDMCQCITESKNPLCKLLPTNQQELFELCHKLYNQKQIVLLNPHDPRKCWVIPNYRHLLQEINGIMTMKVFDSEEHSTLATVQFGKLQEAFEAYNISFIIETLKLLMFCMHVKPQLQRYSQRRSFHMSKSESVLPSTPSLESHHRRVKSEAPDPDTHGRLLPSFFFPSFLPKTPPNPWETDERFTYGFAWTMSLGESHYFLPKFVCELLFILIHSFAPCSPSDPSPLCTAWNEGVCWSDANVGQACVAVHDNRTVTLSMRCLRGREMECIWLRTQIMNEVRKLKAQVAQAREFFIPGDGNRLPITDPSSVPSCYSREAIQQAIEEGCAVLDTKGDNPQELDTLLYFEPLAFLHPSLHEELCNPNNTNDKLSDDFCMTFSKRLGSRWNDLANYYKMEEHYTSSLQQDSKPAHGIGMEILTKYLRYRTGIQTYGELWQSLQDISIFNNEDIDSSIV